MKVLDFGLVKSQEVRRWGRVLLLRTRSPGRRLISHRRARWESRWISGPIVARHVSSEPSPPLRHSRFDVASALHRRVLACLANKPADRPGTARELCGRLGECAAESVWTREDARQWWETRMEAETVVTLSP